jgi:hypothetical protein
LMEREGFRQNAVVRRSVIASLGECVRAQQAASAAGQPSSAFSSARNELAG